MVSRPTLVKKANEAIFPLQATDISLHVGKNKLIENLSLTLDKNQFSVVMGPNGAGKSVLLRLLHGLLEPTSGKILWGDIPINTDIRKRQAMVFQKPVLLRRSVAANIDFVFSLAGRTDAVRRDELLDQIDLLDRAKQPARLLSGGEQQRLALARALATDPEVIFLDEPTASLDPASTQNIENVVSAAHYRGIKIVFVTHDIGQAKRLADEIIFIHGGRLAEHTHAKDFFQNPDSQAAQAYLDDRILLQQNI